jgi:hypothetical protein
VIPGTRLAPLDELADDEAAEWARFVSVMPPNWFTESQPLLEALCRHIVTARRLALQLVEVRNGPNLPLDASVDARRAMRAVDRLLAMHARETRLISMLMVKLRLTPQTRHLSETAEHARAAQPTRRPWQDA